MLVERRRQREPVETLEREARQQRERLMEDRGHLLGEQEDAEDEQQGHLMDDRGRQQGEQREHLMEDRGHRESEQGLLLREDQEDEQDLPGHREGQLDGQDLQLSRQEQEPRNCRRPPTTSPPSPSQTRHTEPAGAAQNGGSAQTRHRPSATHAVNDEDS